MDLPAPREKQSSLPAALGSIDDLLPARAKPKPPTPKTEAFGEIDLPSVAADLPNPVKKPPRPAAADDLELNLGPPAADLPAPLPDLPAVAGMLPQRKAEPAFGEIDLPSLDSRGNLPTAAASGLPTVANVMPQPANVLPQPANMLPQTANMLPQPANVLPSARGPGALDFGEVDLGPLDKPRLPAAPLQEHASFGELDLGGIGASQPPPKKDAPKAELKAPTAFGEVDLGAQAAAPIVQTEASIPAPPKSEAPVSARPSGEVALPIQQRVRAPREEAPRKPSVAGRVALLLFLLVIGGGGALQFTKHGAFGYLTLGDMLHAKDYKSFTDAQTFAARTRTAMDVYPETRGAVDDLFAAHWRMPRATGLTAYTAFAELSYETRFGSDVDRNAKAKLLLVGLQGQPKTPYLAVALAAQQATEGNLAAARNGLEAASRRDTGDPVQRDIALLRGEIELNAKDPKAAKTAFDAALKLGARAQAHYGLARAAAMTHDPTPALDECNAALAQTPHHPGALVLRARERYDAKSDDTGALTDLAEVTGAAKPLASTMEVAQAFADRGHIYLASGRAGDARTAFDAAIKLDSRNVDALMGQGTVFYQESRFTEALSRFDGAIAARRDLDDAIAYDALTKIKLEQLKDAKDQLLAARATFPRSTRIAFALAQAEIALGNSADAEKDLRQAIDVAMPKDPASIEPYVALATLLVAHNRDKDADAVIADARAKLPDQAPVAVAFGEYDEAQGKYDDAVAQFKHALDMSPSSLSTHFKLGVTYRHMHKMDLASVELDKVLALDKDFPNLALERGLLFEDSGEVNRALEQFKTALAKAPDDPDLQLRVGAAYVAIGRPEDALPMLRSVLEKRASSAEANHYLGRAIFAKDGATNEAMRFLKRAVELDPNRAEYHLYVAWAANDASPAQLGIAQDEIDKALGLDKLLADAYWQRGVLERKRLLVEDALKDLRHALELKPTRFDAYATMAECYEDKNDPQTALGLWQKAIAGNGHDIFWKYRYGKLALDRGNAPEAAASLGYAVDEALKLDPRPAWLSSAEFSAAEALRRTGRRADAATMYRRFLEIASTNDPDRRDAINTLQSLGETYRPNR